MPERGEGNELCEREKGRERQKVKQKQNILDVCNIGSTVLKCELKHKVLAPVNYANVASFLGWIYSRLYETSSAKIGSQLRLAVLKSDVMLNWQCQNQQSVQPQTKVIQN